MSAIWQGRRIVICVGTGGVGKTTVAAAMALAAAAEGLRTLVMTIDPARRLANALGIGNIGNIEREIPPSHFAPHGVQLRAPLWVMMPDAKRTFDDLIERSAPNEETRQRILRSRIYQHFSTTLAGAHEYAAVQMLYQVYVEDRYDLIVLDTPPSQNALDFLDAPSRILDFLETETMQWLLKPYLLSGRFSLKILDLGSSFLLSTLGKLAGGETLRELADFLLSFSGLYDGFRKRSLKVRNLLASDEIAFTLITGPTASQQRAMLQFRDELHAEGMRVRAVVSNRTRTLANDAAAVAAFNEHVTRRLPDVGAAARVREALREEAARANLDQANIARLREAVGGTPVITLPELATDVHDLEGLATLHALLAATG